MSIYLPSIQGVYVLLPSGVRNGTQIFTSSQIMDPKNLSGVVPEASGIVAYLDITAAPGVETLQLVLEEQDPASLKWATIAATTATTAVSLVRLKMKPSITAVAASTTGVVVQDQLPASWRLRVVHSGGSNWTYSLGALLYV